MEVLIVGAGLSGIAAAHHLRARAPGLSWLILEARETIGGTWDLFRYPGVRSDSDMHTLGYGFRPWRGEHAITNGASIREYISDTVHEEGFGEHIRFQRRAVHARWSSAQARWTVQVDGPQGAESYSCRFLYMASGYFDYEAGHLPSWPGMEEFKGDLVQPQHWPAELAYAGKRVVIIGSGATAVTLAPEMAKTAAHVTLLQRSPTWIVSRPARDALADRLNRWLPQRLAHAITRWKNVLLGSLFYAFTRRRPKAARERLLAMARAAVGPHVDVERHLTPRYDPWDQRLCLVPDGDLFAALRQGSVEIATDEIERFTASGLRLKSGRELTADVVVAATGLKLQLLGGMALEVDGSAVNLGDALSYKGMMFSDVPNLVLATGYINASWTLRAELTAVWTARLLSHMVRLRWDWAKPRRGDACASEAGTLSLSSGYIQRAHAILPKQGTQAPWTTRQSYLADVLALRREPLEDGVMVFGRAAVSVEAA